MRGPRSTSPCPTQQQVEKLKLLQTAIKKRTTKQDLMTTYKIHIIISIVIGFVIISILSFTKQTKEYIIINESEIKSHNSQGYSYTLGPNTFFYVLIITVCWNIVLLLKNFIELIYKLKNFNSKFYYNIKFINTTIYIDYIKITLVKQIYIFLNNPI